MPAEIAEQRSWEPVIQFSVFMPNRVGRLHHLIAQLAQRGVHAMALCLLDTTENTIARLVVDQPDRARPFLEEYGYAFTECPLVAVEIDSPASLPKVTTILLEAEINIHYAYSFITRPQGKSALALSLEDAVLAQVVLQSSGLKVLSQADIAR